MILYKVLRYLKLPYITYVSDCQQVKSEKNLTFYYKPDYQTVTP